MPQFQFTDRVRASSLYNETDTLGQTVGIPQVQFLDTVFGDCGFWHIDKAVDVPVISSLAPVRALYRLRDSIWTRQRSFTHLKLAT